MSQPGAVDYVVAGLLAGVFALNEQATNHTLAYDDLWSVFWQRYNRELSPEALRYAVKRMEHLGIAQLVVDPYADDIIELGDNPIYVFVQNSEIGLYKRAWGNDEWLKSAYKNERLWIDLDRGVTDDERVEAIPSADGFIQINNNSAEIKQIEEIVTDASDAIRGDNQIDPDQKSWIRTHIEAGIALFKAGGPLLRAALISLLLEPLKAAIKASADDNVKKLVGIAVSALMQLLKK